MSSINELEATIERLKAELAEARIHIKNLRETRDALRDQFKQANEEIERLKAELAEARAGRKERHDTVTKLVNECTQLREQLEGMTKEARKWRSEWENYHAEVGGLRGQVDHLKAELAARSTHGTIFDGLEHWTYDDLQQVVSERDQFQEQLARYQPRNDRKPNGQDSCAELDWFVETWMPHPGWWKRVHWSGVLEGEWWRPINNDPPNDPCLPNIVLGASCDRGTVGCGLKHDDTPSKCKVCGKVFNQMGCEEWCIDCITNRRLDNDPPSEPPNAKPADPTNPAHKTVLEIADDKPKQREWKRVKSAVFFHDPDGSNGTVKDEVKFHESSTRIGDGVTIRVVDPADDERRERLEMLYRAVVRLSVTYPISDLTPVFEAKAQVEATEATGDE